MKLDRVKTSIQDYISSDKKYPLIVDFDNAVQLQETIEYFNTGVNKFVFGRYFCNDDGIFKLDEFYNAIETTTENIFVTEFSPFLQIQGERYTRNTLQNLVNKTVNVRVVMFTYCCRKYLQFNDPRIKEAKRILIVEGDRDKKREIRFIPSRLSGCFPSCFEGFDNFGHIIEDNTADNVYIATDIPSSYFPHSIFTITSLVNGYDALCERDAMTSDLPYKSGTDEMWLYALELMAEHESWRKIGIALFGSVSNLTATLGQYNSFDSKKQWLYFVLLSLFGAKENEYLKLAITNCQDYTELEKQLYRAILTVDKDSHDFEKYYAQRKDILKNITGYNSDVKDFCKLVAQKEGELIYYLTDLTQLEKERIITWLDHYGTSYTREQLIAILRNVYPDLADYLKTFRFHDDFLNDYFDQYKYQKVINKIIPDFQTIVDTEATKSRYPELLKPRSSVIANIDTDDTEVYFVDAMGVEYLGFIQAKCVQYGLSVSITSAYCELPSLTECNKDFVDFFRSKGVKVNDNIKELDEIKHHGENNFDYEKVKTPVYIIRELEIIDELLNKIRVNIDSGLYTKAVVLSDHGTSRLAVIHESENLLEMSEKGIHSGRCVQRQDTDTKPVGSIDRNGYWVLANYDRFKGSRKANVEVHGGATLEEVAVPVIEITEKHQNVEAFIEDGSKVISRKAKVDISIKLYVALKSNNISVALNGKYYDAKKTSEDYIYTVAFPDVKANGEFSIDIYNGAEVLATEQKFNVKSKVANMNISLFD